MARKVTVKLICDLPHDHETGAAGTARLTLGQAHYELDLCSDHRADFDAKLGPFTRAGRVVRSSRSRSSRQVLKERREWLRSEEGGFPDLSDRGPLPRAAREALEARHR